MLSGTSPAETSDHRVLDAVQRVAQRREVYAVCASLTAARSARGGTAHGPSGAAACTRAGRHDRRAARRRDFARGVQRRARSHRRGCALAADGFCRCSATSRRRPDHRTPRRKPPSRGPHCRTTDARRRSRCIRQYLVWEPCNILHFFSSSSPCGADFLFHCRKTTTQGPQQRGGVHGPVQPADPACLDDWNLRAARARALRSVARGRNRMTRSWASALQ
jgi:hypothetical protein